MNEDDEDEAREELIRRLWEEISDTNQDPLTILNVYFVYEHDDTDPDEDDEDTPLATTSAIASCLDTMELQMMGIRP